MDFLLHLFIIQAYHVLPFFYELPCSFFIFLKLLATLLLNVHVFPLFFILFVSLFWFWLTCFLDLVVITNVILTIVATIVVVFNELIHLDCLLKLNCC